YLSGDDGYVKILMQLAKGIALTGQALRQARPDAMLVHVEDVGTARAATADLAEVAALSQAKRFLPLDLMCGKVGPDHPLYPWLVEHGATEAELGDLAARLPR